MDLIDDAGTFLRTNARLLDWRRFELLFRDGDPDGVLAALGGYRNADGGFGWGLEPDLRAPGSQPGAALHAFEVLAEIAPGTSPMAVALCDWLARVTLDDGGLPFALAGAGGPGTAPWWGGADPQRSSLHITCAVVEAAHLVAGHDRAVADHPWLARATAFCLREIAAFERPSGGGYELMYVLRMLDAAFEAEPDARRHLDRLVELVPASATLPVQGGGEDEVLRPLHVAPRAGGPLRERLDPAPFEADRERLLAARRDDGGWDVEFETQSPAGALEWRGYATVDALKALGA